METRFLSIYFTSGGGVEHNLNKKAPFAGTVEELLKWDVSVPPEVILGDELPVFPDPSPDPKIPRVCHLRTELTLAQTEKAAGNVVYLWTASAIFMNKFVVQEEKKELEKLLAMKDSQGKTIWELEETDIIMRIPDRGGVFFLHRLKHVVK